MHNENHVRPPLELSNELRVVARMLIHQDPENPPTSKDLSATAELLVEAAEMVEYFNAVPSLSSSLVEGRRDPMAVMFGLSMLVIAVVMVSLGALSAESWAWVWWVGSGVTFVAGSILFGLGLTESDGSLE